MRQSAIITATVIIALVAIVVALSLRLRDVISERDLQRNNVDILMTNADNYRVNDSLRAATIGDLQLTLSQYKQYRKDDAEIISNLRLDNKRLQAVISTQTESYYQHTVILRDSIKLLESELNADTVIIKTAHYSDKWHRLSIVIDGDSVNYNLTTNERLLITNHIVPKKFLWFKFGCKDIRTDVVSKNPYVTRLDIESVKINR